MRWASDTASGQLVAADKAVQRRVYRCPKCNARVRLRLGLQRSAHFAHQAGEGKPDCEYYFPTFGDGILGPTFGPPSTGPTRLIKAIPLPLLCIELEPDSKWRPGQGRRWGLRLSLPKSEDSHGKIQLDDGHLKPVHVSMGELSLGSKAIVLNPAGKDFGTHWISPEVRPAYRQAISQRVEGLSRNQINIFATSPQRYKPRSNELFWGDAYYFVWHSSCPSNPPPNIVRHTLSDTDAWKCCLIVLPQDPDEDIRQWVSRSCVAPLSSERRQWAIAYPPPYGLDINGFIQVPPVDMMLIGVTVPSNTGGSSRLQYASSQGDSGIHLTANGKHLVKCQVHINSSFHRFMWNELPLASIRHASHGVDPVRGVGITYTLRKDGARREAELHTIQGQDALKLVRNSIADLVAMYLPYSIYGSLRWRSIVTRQSGVLDIPGSDQDRQDRSLKLSQAKQINSTLQDKSLEIRLRFDAFGEFYADADFPRPHQTTNILSANLRARIMWLLSCTRTAPSVVTIRQHPNDFDLICRLKSAQCPRHLLSHKRSIERQIDLMSGQFQ